MLRSKFSIENDLEFASKRMKPFYRECLLVVDCYTELGVQTQLKNVQKSKKVFMDRRKKYPDEYQYKPEIKALNKTIKWCKYLLNEKKISKYTKKISRKY